MKNLYKEDNGFICGKNVYDYIEYCNENNLSVIGVEGFICNEGEIKPDMDCILDLSELKVDNWEEYKKQSLKIVRDFLKQQELSDKNDRQYDFVLLTKNDYDKMNE